MFAVEQGCGKVTEVADGALLHIGWHDAHVAEAWQHKSCTIGLAIAVREAPSRYRIFIDYPTDSKLRRCCEAVDAMEAYEAGRLTPAHFLGQKLWIKIDIKKRGSDLDGGFNCVWDYAEAVGLVIDQLRAITPTASRNGRFRT